jgi:DoxX-like family
MSLVANHYTHPTTSSTSTGQQWAGRITGGLVVAFMLFDAIIHILVIPPVVTAFNQLGYPVSLSVGLGILELACITLYVVSPTSVLGAILLTGYLGGAIASQVRIGAGVFPIVFASAVGVLFWVGLYLREDRLRELLPFRG